MKIKTLHVGCNYPKDFFNMLYGPISDALLWSGLLKDAWNVREEDMVILRDDYDNDLFPTRDTFFYHLKKMFNELDSNDLAIITVSAHGIQDDYKDDINKEEADLKNEYLILYDNKKNIISVSDDELNEVLNYSRCNVLIFNDTCNSNTMWDLKYNYTIDKKSTNEDLIFIRKMESKRPVRNKNIFCLSASKDEQLTGETFIKERNNDYGLFTHEIINAIRKNNYNLPILYLYFQVVEIFKEKYSKLIDQTPTFSSNNEEPLFILSKQINSIDIVDKIKEKPSGNINAKYFYIDKKLVQDDKTTNTKESNVEAKESNIETKKATTNRKYNPKKSLLKMKYN
jgi:hypothetical protein